MAGPLSYALTLNTSKFTAPLRGAQNMVRGIGSTAVGAAGSLLRIVGPIAAIAGGLGGLGIALMAFKKASDFEQTTTSLRVLIGDVDKTKKLLTEVKAISSSTPFQFTELANSTRQLVAMDIAVEKIPSSLNRIGDIASGVQAPIEELALLYGRANNDGILYSETLNQFNDRGIPIFKELANVTGASITEVKKMASEGKITFPLLEQSFMNLTKEGGKFHGMMAEQSKTNAGLMSTLKDGLSDILLTIGTPMGDALKPILVQAIGLVKRIGLGLVGVVEIAKGAIAQGKLGELISHVMIIGLKETANYAAGAFVFMGDMLFRSLLLAFKTVITLFTGGFNEAIGNLAKGLLKVFGGLGQVILSKLGNAFLTVGAYFQSALVKALNWFLNKLGSTALGKALGISVDERSFDEILAASKKMMQAGKLQESGRKLMQKGKNQMRKGFGDTFDKVKSHASEVYDGLKFEKVNLLDSAENKKAAADIAKAASPEGFSKLMDAINGPAEALKEGAEEIKKAGDPVAEGLEKALATAKGVAKETKKAADNLKGGKLPGDDKSKKKSGLLGTAESLSARFSRLSGNKGTFQDFVGKSLTNRRAVKDYAKSKGISIKEAIAQLSAGVKTARKSQRGVNKPDGKAPVQATQETILSVMQRIDGKLDGLSAG